ncbi:MAG TPA: hypothetical protein P5547_06730 [Spirochaetota bacterium]|nr:hypothetical protein [Spirochaetota bacterium]HOM86923.1 hypothetical protein [Spirochaetota bacterium]HPD04624.1 hypothetical protein [Spirochaetota bacterium]HRR60616.1 hypothetical protein [Spirochaetota bacterium]HRV14533.1 hypothetical protein [Spirochaetota bacterium]
MTKENGNKPYALILAGYDKPDRSTMIKRKKQIIEAYDGDSIYIGKNKFLQQLAGKPVIQYVLDAVYNAKKKGKPLYDAIYVYNDVKNFTDVIDTRKYHNLHVMQMKQSVGGHLKDFYFNHLEYGRRVDIFFGDTPRITSEDVEWINSQYDTILGKAKDYRGITAHVAYGIVEYEDLKDDTWLNHRLKIIKRGQNKGKLKNFVGFTTFEARVGNSAALLKHRSLDSAVEYEIIDFFYSLRKALAPNIFSKIIYYLWKTKNFILIRQIKRHCIEEERFYKAAINVIERVYNLDLSKFGGYIFHIKHNAAHWENDIDGPKDLKTFRAHIKK